MYKTAIFTLCLVAIPEQKRRALLWLTGMPEVMIDDTITIGNQRKVSYKLLFYKEGSFLDNVGYLEVEAMKEDTLSDVFIMFQNELFYTL